MTYTVTELITNAFYVSNIVSKGSETVTGEQLNEGLQLLNALLSLKSANTNLIPYYKKYDFNLVAGQETYQIPNLKVAETVTFFFGSGNNTIRFSLDYQGRKNYYGSTRLENLRTLPITYRVDLTQNGSQISFYPIPNQNYPAQIWGKFGFDSVTLNDDLETTYNLYYIDYLRLKLAQRLCADYSINFQPQALALLSEYENIIDIVAPPDMTIKRRTIFGAGSGLNWGDVNLAHLWRSF